MDQLKKFMEMSTCHGVADAHASKSVPGKLFWSTLILLSFTNIIQQVYVFTKDFMRPDKWGTSITFGRVQRMPYPKITVCNLSPFNRTRRLEHPVEHQEAIEFVHAFYLSLQKSRANKPIVRRWLNRTRQAYLQSLASEPNLGNLHQVLTQTTMTDCRGTFIMCRMRQTNAEFPCCPYVTRVISGDEPCQTMFLSYKGKRNKQEGPGPKHGVKLILNPGTEHAGGESSNEGFRLYFNFGGTDVFETSDPVVVAPGTHNFISMEAVKHSWLKPSGFYSSVLFPKQPPCVRSRQLNVLSGNYSIKACEIDCSLRLPVRQCNGCSYVPLPIRPDSPYRHCNVTEAYECVEAYRERHDILRVQTTPGRRWSGARTDPWSVDYRKCLRTCRSPCEFDSIEAKVSVNALGGSRVNSLRQDLLSSARGYGGNFTDDQLNKMISVHIFYAKNQYKIVQTSLRFTTDQIISQIGGSMGVWAGLSLMTLVQFVVYMLDAGYAGVVQILHRHRLRRMARKKAEEFAAFRSQQQPVPSPHPPLQPIHHLPSPPALQQTIPKTDDGDAGKIYLQDTTEKEAEGEEQIFVIPVDNNCEQQEQHENHLLSSSSAFYKRPKITPTTFVHPHYLLTAGNDAQMRMTMKRGLARTHFL